MSAAHPGATLEPAGVAAVIRVVIPMAIGQTLSDAVLAGLAAQELAHELVVVATPGVAERGARVKLKRRHAMASRNACLGVMTADAIAVMQDSDVCHLNPKNLGDLVARLRGDPRLGAVSLSEMGIRALSHRRHTVGPDGDPVHIWSGCVAARAEVWRQLRFDPAGSCACRQISAQVRALGFRHVYLDDDRKRVFEERVPFEPELRDRAAGTS